MKSGFKELFGVDRPGDADKKLLEDALRALRVIHTWATFRGGVALTPANVAKICESVLRKVKGEGKP